MHNKGWIKLHLKSLENPLFSHDPTAWHVFEACLLLAYPKGTFETGRFVLAKQCGFKPMLTYKALKRLEKYEMVNIKSNNKYSTISICNWESYQSVGNTSVNNTLTTKGQQRDTLLRIRIKNKETLHTIVLTADEVREFQEKFPGTNIPEEIEKANDYIRSKGKSYKDLKAFFRNWLRSPYRSTAKPDSYFEKATDGKIFATQEELESAINQKEYGYRVTPSGATEFYPLTGIYV